MYVTLTRCSTRSLFCLSWHKNVLLNSRWGFCGCDDCTKTRPICLWLLVSFSNSQHPTRFHPWLRSSDPAHPSWPMRNVAIGLMVLRESEKQAWAHPDLNGPHALPCAAGMDQNHAGQGLRPRRNPRKDELSPYSLTPLRDCGHPGVTRGRHWAGLLETDDSICSSWLKQRRIYRRRPDGSQNPGKAALRHHSPEPCQHPVDFPGQGHELLGQSLKPSLARHQDPPWGCFPAAPRPDLRLPWCVECAESCTVF